jgi:predicted secreted protein
MNLVGGFVIFAISWWICLFAVLPIGIRGQFEDGDIIEGTEEGAPAEHMLPKKALWASIGAVICTAIAGLVVIPWLQSQGA